MSSERHDERLARWAKEGNEGTPPVPAATVVLLRDGDDGLETLMLRRNSKIAFGGMWVFPGGRVETDDEALVAPGDDLAAARLAAVREALEETGLAVVADHMVALSHWTPPPITPRRFFTWFFLAPAPSGAVEIDHGEIHEYAWLSSEGAFARRDAGEIELAPPTWVTLHAIAACSSVEEALGRYRGGEPERFETRVGLTEEGPVALWHGDAGYADADATAPGDRHRLSMLKERWRYERSS